MKKIISAIAGIILSITLASAIGLTISETPCNCSSCADCTTKLNDPACSVVLLTVNITNQSGSCISNPSNFSSKTFDCQSNRITGDFSGAGSGFYVGSKSGNTIENCVISGFGNGISLYTASGNTITNNIISSNRYGISNSYSSGNTISGNNVSENTYYDVYFEANSESQCDNAVENNTGSGGRPIGYYNNSVSIHDAVFSTLILCNADRSNISNITIAGSDSIHSNGLLAYMTDYSRFTNVNSSDNYVGILLYYSANNTLLNTVLKENAYQDIAFRASGKGQCDNIIQNNTGSGGRPIIYYNGSVSLQDEVLSELILCGADYSSVENVTIAGSDSMDNNGFFVYVTDYSNFTSVNSSDNYYGVYIENSKNNTLIGGNLDSDSTGVDIMGGSGNSVIGTNASFSNYGIYAYNSPNTAIINNTANHNKIYGIYLSYASYSTVWGNTAKWNNDTGINLYMAYSTIANNTAQENAKYDIGTSASSETMCMNTVENNTGSGGRPIGYYNESVNVSDKTYSELILCNADNSNFTNIQVAGSDTLKNNGVIIRLTQNANMTNITSSENYQGLYIYDSENNTISESTFNSNNDSGIYVYYSSGSELIEDVVNGNNIGIYLSYATNTTLVGNNVNLSLNTGILSASSTGTTINSNTVCSSINLDLNATNWVSSSGDNNTCDKSDGWSDTGKTGCSLFCNGTVNIHPTEVVINEFYTTYPGWIELYNKGAVVANLTNWVLGHNSTSENYSITSGTIPTHGFLVLNQTDISLAINGTSSDTLFLWNSSGYLINQISHSSTCNSNGNITPCPMPPIISVGRFPDGSDNLVSLYNQTPGTSNTYWLIFSEEILTGWNLISIPLSV